MAFGVDAQAFFARIEDFHRAIGDFGRQRSVNLSGNVLLAAEAASHDGAAHAHLLILQPQALGYLATVAVGNLATHIHRELGVFAIITRRNAHRTLRLKEGMFGHWRTIGALDNHVSLGKARLDIPLTHFDVFEQVAGGTVRMQHRRIGLACAHRVSHRGQRLILHAYMGKGRVRLVFAFCHHKRHRVAHIAHRIVTPGKDRPIILDQTVARVAWNIFVCQHRDHPWLGEGRAGIYAQDTCVGVCAAQRCAM